VAKAVPVPLQLGFPFDPDGQNSAGRQRTPRKGGVNRMSILWIILIVILVLALLGFFSRGRW
jgi:flagellar basal body-associated protein FliL